MKGIKSAASGLRLERRGGIDSCMARESTSVVYVGFEEDIEDEDTESEDIEEYTGGDTAAGHEEGTEVTLLEEGLEEGIPDNVLILFEGCGGKTGVC